MWERYCPHQTARRVEDLDLEALRASGLRGLLLDLDNTLTPWHGYEITPALRDWLQQAKGMFQVGILSNAISGRRVRRIAAELGVPCVYGIGPWGKPNPGPFRRALAKLGTAPEETAMIGDQLFTDVCGARRSGLRAILVRPVGERELFLTRWSRARAARIEERLRREGRWPEEGEGRQP